MPYPADPFALKLRVFLKCPNNHIPIVLETKNQQSSWMGQVRCEQCGFVSEDVAGMRAAQSRGRQK
jgi:hypothetical protein